MISRLFAVIAIALIGAALWTSIGTAREGATSQQSADSGGTFTSIPDYAEQWMPSPNASTTPLIGLLDSKTVSGIFRVEVPYGLMGNNDWMVANGYFDRIPPPATITFTDGEVLEIPAGSRLVSDPLGITLPVPSGAALSSPLLWGAYGQVGEETVVSIETAEDGSSRYFVDGEEITEEEYEQVNAGLGYDPSE